MNTHQFGLYKHPVDDELARRLFLFLKFNMEWEDGPRSRKGYTRKAKPLNIGDIEEVDIVIMDSLTKVSKISYEIHGIYLNYYEDGNMWTPNHSHPGTHQLVVSLGATRTLTVGKKKYQMDNGDTVLFGSAIHGVPKDESVKHGRISIATFMTPHQ